MWSSVRAAVIVCATLFAGAVAWYAVSASVDGRLAACGREAKEKQVECIFGVIEKELERGGITAGFDVFARSYERFYSFSSTGCHRYAHRVGDLAYYHDYLSTGNIRALEFPQETTACGYGFFHGFLEHLIQDRPTPEFVTETCEYLKERLGRTMADIGIICYHGSGHGFQLAEAERVPKAQWGNAGAFATKPLSSCDALPGASDAEREECRQGVFNVIVDWMEAGQYGFAYDTAEPFSACFTFAERYHFGCVYEVAQKLDSLSGMDPRRIAEIASGLRSEKLADVAFRVGVAGIIQQTIADGNGYALVLERCAALRPSFFSRCAESIVHGLFEHGNPQKEYEKALAFCAEVIVAERGASAACYETVARRLPRFYGPERLPRICREFPEDFRARCEEISAEPKRG